MVNPPAGASINSQTGEFSWIPTFSQAESYSITFTATAGADTVQASGIVQILNTNRKPQFTTQPAISASENQQVQFSVFAIDPDGDAVTYSASSVPSGAFFLAGTGMFTWTPSYLQAGSYSPTIIASDGQAAESMPVSISINDVSTAPAISFASPSAIDTTFGYLNVTTSTNASCRYATSDISFESMYVFEKSTGFAHSQLLTSLSGSTTFFVKCRGQGLDQSSAQQTITIAQAPTADILMDPRSPTRPGLIGVTLQANHALQVTPSLYYFFDDAPGDKKLVSLEPVSGSQTVYRGYMVIPKIMGMKTGTFEFRGIDLVGVVGTQIKTGKTFITDDQAPLPPKTFVAKSVPTGIELSWIYSEESVREFKVYRRQETGVSYNDYSASINGSVYVDTLVSANTPYYYKITAVDLAGNEGELSLETSAVAPDVQNIAQGTGSIAVISPKLSPASARRLNSTIKLLESSLLDIELVRSTLDTSTQKQLVASLSLMEAVVQMKGEIEGMRNELQNQNVYEIGDEDVDKLVERALLKQRKLNQTVVREVEQTDTSDSAQTLSLDRIDSLAETTAGAINFTKSQRAQYITQFKDWNNKLSVRVSIQGARLTYLDGHTEQVTLVKKDVSYEGAVPLKNAWLMEKIPKDVAEKASDMAFNPMPTVVESDPLVRYSLPEGQHFLLQYVVRKNAADAAKSATTYLQQDPSVFMAQFPNKISGFSIMPNLGKGSFGIVIMVLGTLVVLGLGGLYLFLHDRNKKASRTFAAAPQEQQVPPFIIDGKELRGVPELLVALETMDDSTFSRFVNAEKNDFCHWMKDGLDEPQLAESLYNIRDKVEFKNHLLIAYSQKVLKASG